MPQQKQPDSDKETQQSPIGECKRNFKNQKPEPPFKLDEEECKKYTIKKPYPQRFSLPENILFYMAKNPINLQCHQNLMKTCKYIFRHSRIIPVDAMYNNASSNDVAFMKKSNLNKIIVVDFEKLSSFKLWLHSDLSILSTKNSNQASILTKTIYQCSLEMLALCEQVLTIGELRILAGGGKLHTIDFCSNTIENADGSITEFEKVFEILLCKNMDIWFHSDQHGVGINTAKRVAEILKSQKKSHRIKLRCIPQAFDFHSFSEFLKANIIKRKHIIDLRFDDIASDEYKNQLQQFVNQIIQIRDVCGPAVPIVQFNGQNDAAYEKLQNMRFRRI